MNVLIRIDATINSQAHEKRKEKLRLSKKKKCTQRTSLDCTQARLRHPKSGAPTHTHAHTDTHSQRRIFVYVRVAWVGGFEGATGRWVGRLCVGASICWGKCVFTRIFVFECEGSHVLV